MLNIYKCDQGLSTGTLGKLIVQVVEFVQYSHLKVKQKPIKSLLCGCRKPWESTYWEIHIYVIDLFILWNVLTCFFYYIDITIECGSKRHWLYVLSSQGLNANGLKSSHISRVNGFHGYTLYIQNIPHKRSTFKNEFNDILLSWEIKV